MNQSKQVIQQQPQVGPGLTNQGILQSALSRDNPQAPQAQDNTTLKGLLGMKPNPINQQPGWNYQARGQLSAGNIPGQLQQPQGVTQRFTNPQQQQQQQQMMQQGMVHPGSQQGAMPGMMQTNQGMVGVGGMAGPVGVQVSQGGMTGGQVHQSAMGVQAAQVGMQSAGMQGGMPGQMGLQQGQAGMMNQTGMQQAQRTNQQRERQIIWSGELEWQEKVKDGPADQKIAHSVACTVSTSKDNGQAEVQPENWPSKLIMQLIPKTLVQTIGGQYFRHSKSVLFHPTECESLEALTKVMGSGFAGCVHFTGNCDIKVLILLYSSEKKAYLGFIPNDQASFVDRIRTVIQQQKAGQMRQGMQQQQQQGQQMMNPQQQQGGMAMQSNIINQQSQQQGGMMNPGMMSQQQQPMSSTGGMMAGQQQQMVMMSGGQQMVRMPQQGQFMMMQGPGGPTRMMQQHNPGLRQILQQPNNMQGMVMQNQAMQPNMQGMQGGMMMQQRMGQGAMMTQQQQQQQQQSDPLRDLLN